jgi:hypothetical protein
MLLPLDGAPNLLEKPFNCALLVQTSHGLNMD